MATLVSSDGKSYVSNVTDSATIKRLKSNGYSETSSSGSDIQSSWGSSGSSKSSSSSSSSSNSSSKSSSSSGSSSSSSSGGTRVYNPTTGKSFLVHDNEVSNYTSQGYTLSPTTSGNDSSNSPTSTETPTYTPVEDNSEEISESYDAAKESAIAELKQAIASSKSKYQTTIDETPTTYQPYRDQVSANRYQNLSSLRESLANQGQQGGVNRTEETRVNAAAESDINTLNTQQQQVINEANTAISDLEASGDLEEAQIVAQNAYERLQALATESTRVSESNYQRLRDAIADAQYQESSDYTKSQDTLQNALAEAQLTGTNLENEYQKLVNAGYPAAQAAELAQAAASTAKAYSSGSSSSYKPTQTEKTNNATAGVISELQSAISSGATREQILSQIQQNMAKLVSDGVNMTTVNSWLENIQTSDEQQADAEAKNKKAWDDSSVWYKLTHGTMFGSGN